MPIRFGSWWTPVLVVCGIPPGTAYVDVGAETVSVRLGLAFRSQFPRAAIRSPRRLSGKGGEGAHGRRGVWRVNGARGSLVSFELDPESRARVYGVPVRLRELTLSVEDPDALIARLAA